MAFDPLSLIPVMFQFHKGSINTVLKLVVAIAVAVFQFHKGSINTGIGCWLNEAEEGFNSIKVRLIQRIQNL